LRPHRRDLKNEGMLVFACEGPRSIADDDIVACYADASVGLYCNVTVCLFDGREISGRAHASAVATLRDRLDDFGTPPPPLAA
jgi:hypothetical protein